MVAGWAWREDRGSLQSLVSGTLEAGPWEEASAECGAPGRWGPQQENLLETKATLRTGQRHLGLDKGERQQKARGLMASGADLARAEGWEGRSSHQAEGGGGTKGRRGQRARQVERAAGQPARGRACGRSLAVPCHLSLCGTKAPASGKWTRELDWAPRERWRRKGPNHTPHLKRKTCMANNQDTSQ